MRVLIVGFGPGAVGSVFRLARLVPTVGGTRPFRLKLTNFGLTYTYNRNLYFKMLKTFFEIVQYV